MFILGRLASLDKPVKEDDTRFSETALPSFTIRIGGIWEQTACQRKSGGTYVPPLLRNAAVSLSVLGRALIC